MSPYRYPNKIPKVAQNWTPAQQRRCTRAAQSVLNRGGTEEEAIYACIHAAKRKQYDPDLEDQYEETCEEASQEFQELVLALLAGSISMDSFSSSFRSRLEVLFTDLMVLGLHGTEVTDRHREELARLLDREYEFFGGFEDDIRAAIAANTIQSGRLTWRASLYGYARMPFTAFTIPVDVIALMPFLPGEDCLGRSLCKCWLEVDEDDDNYYVYWNVNPAAENCIVCLGHEDESPFTFSKADLRGDS